MASNENLALSTLNRASASGYEENGLQRAQSRHPHPYEVQMDHVSLPKADGGKDAWLFLAGCFCIEALTWGECIPQRVYAPPPVVPPAFPYHKAVDAGHRDLYLFNWLLAFVVIGFPNSELQLLLHCPLEELKGPYL